MATIPSSDQPMPFPLTNAAGLAIRYMQETHALSFMELSAVFKIAATACEEAHALHEKELLTKKLRGFRFGGGPVA